MRLPALAAAALLALAGCGRLGYDEVNGSDDGGDGGGADATDATDGNPAGVLLQCDTPTELMDWGDTGGGSAPFFALDVAPTAGGFLVVWSAGNGYIMTTGLRLNEGPRLENIQTASQVSTGANASLSVSSMGDAAMLGVDDPAGPGIRLFALDEHGYERSSSKYIDDYRAYGHDFVHADGPNDQFVVMSSNGSAVASFTRDHDIHPRTGPDMSFAVGSEGAAAAASGGGASAYTLITGNSNNCDVAQVNASMAIVGTPQPISMTCHNATLVQVPGSPNILAAWNCNNDQVWTLAGDPAQTLPAFHAIYGDGSNSSSDPRLAVAPEGIWYGFMVGTDRLGRALLDADSNPVPGMEGTVKVTSSTLKAYDLQVGYDGHAFLFWLDVASSTKLMVMKLCPP